MEEKHKDTAIARRRAAAKAGQTFYDVGVPCRHGHTSGRYTSNGGCAECLKAATTKSRRKRDQVIRATLRAARGG